MPLPQVFSKFCLQTPLLPVNFIKLTMKSNVDKLLRFSFKSMHYLIECFINIPYYLIERNGKTYFIDVRHSHAFSSNEIECKFICMLPWSQTLSQLDAFSI